MARPAGWAIFLFSCLEYVTTGEGLLLVLWRRRIDVALEQIWHALLHFVYGPLAVGVPVPAVDGRFLGWRPVGEERPGSAEDAAIDVGRLLTGQVSRDGCQLVRCGPMGHL